MENGTLMIGGNAGVGKSTLLTCVSLWEMETLIIKSHTFAGKSTVLTCVSL